MTKPNRIVEPKRDAPRRKFRQGGVKQKNILRERKGQCDGFAAVTLLLVGRTSLVTNEKCRRVFRLRQISSQAKICL
ncbi:MAG: hypothetical protein ACK4ZJ_12155 [Allorhizobium sp.]